MFQLHSASYLLYPRVSFARYLLPNLPRNIEYHELTSLIDIMRPLMVLAITAPTFTLGQTRGPSEPSGSCEPGEYSRSYNDCTLYSYCRDGSWTLMRCKRPGFQWSMDKEQCVDPEVESAGCIQAWIMYGLTVAWSSKILHIDHMVTLDPAVLFLIVNSG